MMTTQKLKALVNTVIIPNISAILFIPSVYVKACAIGNGVETPVAYITK